MAGLKSLAQKGLLIVEDFNTKSFQIAYPISPNASKSFVSYCKRLETPMGSLEALLGSSLSSFLGLRLTEDGYYVPAPLVRPEESIKY